MGTIFHNRGNACYDKGDYARAIADYDAAIKMQPNSPFSYQNRGIAKEALGELDGALANINQAIRLDPTQPQPQPLINRTAIWRASGDLDRVIADGSEVQQMLTRVRAEVVSSTKNKQVPWSNSSLLGEVYLAEK